MQKLLENKRYQKKRYQKKKSGNNLNHLSKKKRKRRRYFRNAYRTKFYKWFFYSVYLNRLYRFKRFKGFRKHLTITLSSNNVFCTLKNIKSNILYLSKSSGNYKTRVTKKSLKYVTPSIILSFFAQNRINFKNCSLILVLIAPLKLRKHLIKLLYKNLKYSYKVRNLIFCVKSKKCYNGCRSPKKRRKKKRVLQKFK